MYIISKCPKIIILTCIRKIAICCLEKKKGKYLNCYSVCNWLDDLIF